MNERLARTIESVHDALVDQVRNELTPDLLKPQFREAPFPTGHCYVASEAIYHLLGGPSSGLKPVRLKMDDGVVHWWLEDQEGNVIDATHDQFSHEIPYEQGRPGGFLTKEPSARARQVMERVDGKTAASDVRPAWVYDPETDQFYTGDFHRQIIRDHDLNNRVHNESEPGVFGLRDFSTPLVLGLFDRYPYIASDYGKSGATPEQENRGLQLAMQHYLDAQIRSTRETAALAVQVEPISPGDPYLEQSGLAYLAINSHGFNAMLGDQIVGSLVYHTYDNEDPYNIGVSPEREDEHDFVYVDWIYVPEYLRKSNVFSDLIAVFKRAVGDVPVYADFMNERLEQLFNRRYKMTGYEQQREAGIQPIELMCSDRSNFLYYLNGGADGDPNRGRLAWCWQDGSLYIGAYHRDIMSEMRHEGLNPRKDAMYGWIDPVGDGQEWSYVTDYGTQTESLKPKVEAFFQQYPPSVVMNYARTGEMTPDPTWIHSSGWKMATTVEWVETRPEGPHGGGFPWIYVPDHDVLYIGTTEDMHRMMIVNNSNLRSHITADQYSHEPHKTIVAGRIDAEGRYTIYDQHRAEVMIEAPEAIIALQEAWPEIQEAFNNLPDAGDTVPDGPTMIDESDADGQIKTARQPTDLLLPANPVGTQGFFAYVYSPKTDALMVQPGGIHRELGPLFKRNFGDPGKDAIYGWMRNGEVYQHGLGDVSPELKQRVLNLSAQSKTAGLIDVPGGGFADIGIAFLYWNGDLYYSNGGHHPDLVRFIKQKDDWNSMREFKREVKDGSAVFGFITLPNSGYAQNSKNPLSNGMYIQFESGNMWETNELTTKQTIADAKQMIEDNIDAMTDASRTSGWKLLSSTVKSAWRIATEYDELSPGQAEDIAEQRYIVFDDGTTEYSENMWQTHRALVRDTGHRAKQIVDAGYVMPNGTLYSFMKHDDAYAPYIEEHPSYRPERTTAVQLVDTPGDGYGGMNAGATHTTVYDPKTDTLYVNTVPGASHRSLLRAIKSEYHEENAPWQQSGFAFGYVNPWSATYHQYDLTKVRAPEAMFADAVRALRAERPDFWDAVDMRVQAKMVKTAAGTVMYHGSPPKNRQSIMQHGLRASWDEDVDDEPGVFMTAQPWQIGDDPDSGGEQDDIWEVNVDGLDVKPDPWGSLNGIDYLSEYGGSWYVPHDIPPERLRLLNSSTRQTAFDPHLIEPVDDSCYLVAADLAAQYPELEYQAGQYKNMGEHAWLRMKDGTIIDPTHGQYDESKPMQVVKPTDPAYKNYRAWQDNPNMRVDWNGYPPEMMDDPSDPLHWLFRGKPGYPHSGPDEFDGAIAPKLAMPMDIPPGMTVRMEQRTTGWAEGMWQVIAELNGKEIGHLWLGEDDTISHVWVDQDYQRRGIATVMMQAAEEHGHSPQHDWLNMTDEGKAWAQGVGGQVPGWLSNSSSKNTRVNTLTLVPYRGEDGWVHTRSRPVVNTVNTPVPLRAGVRSDSSLTRVASTGKDYSTLKAVHARYPNASVQEKLNMADAWLLGAPLNSPYVEEAPRLDPHQTLPSRVPPIDSGTLLFKSHNFSSFSGKALPNSPTLRDSLTHPLGASGVNAVIVPNNVPHVGGDIPFAYDSESRTVYVMDSPGYHRELRNWLRSNNINEHSVTPSVGMIYGEYIPPEWLMIYGRNQPKELKEWANEYFGKKLVLGADSSDTTGVNERPRVEPHFATDTPPKTATTVQYIREDQRLIDSTRTPIMWDSANDTVYIGDRGGTHPPLLEAARGVRMHMGEVPLKRKDIYTTLAAGLYTPMEGELPYGNAIPGYVEWFYGPDVPPEVDEQIKDFCENQYVDPRTFVRQASMPTVEEYDEYDMIDPWGGETGRPFLYDVESNTIHLGPEGAMHGDLWNAMKRNGYQKGDGKLLDGALNDPDFPNADGWYFSGKWRDSDMQKAVYQALQPWYKSVEPIDPPDWLPGDGEVPFYSAAEPIKEVRVPVRMQHDWGDYPFMYIPSINTMLITEIPGFHRDLSVYVREHNMRELIDKSCIIGEYYVDPNGGRGIDYYQRPPDGVIPDNVHNFLQGKLAELLLEKKMTSVITPKKVQWIGEPSRNAIWVWHIPTNTLVFASMFQTYHRTIMREMEPEAKIKDSDKLFLVGELDNISDGVTDMIEISNRDGSPYRNPEVANAVVNAYNENGGASLPPSHPGITSSTQWVEKEEGDDKDHGYDEPWVSFVYLDGNLYMSHSMIHPQILRQLGLKAKDLGKILETGGDAAAGWFRTDINLGTFNSFDAWQLNGRGNGQDLAEAEIHKEFPDVQFTDAVTFYDQEHSSKVSAYYHFIEERDAESRWGGLPFIITQEDKLIVSDDPEQSHRALAKMLGMSNHDILTAGIVFPNHTFTILWGHDGDIDELQDRLSDELPDSTFDVGYNLDPHIAATGPWCTSWDGSWFYLPDTDELFATMPTDKKSDHRALRIVYPELKKRLREEPFVAGWYTYPEELQTDDDWNDLTDRSQGIKVVPWGSDWLNTGQTGFTEDAIDPEGHDDPSVIPRVVELSHEKFPHFHFTG